MVLVAVVAGIGLTVLRDDAGATVAGGCSGSADLRIAAAPALASTLEDFADDFDTWAEDRAGIPCTTTTITSASPQEFSAAVGQALDGDTGDAPTTWVTVEKGDLVIGVEVTGAMKAVDSTPIKPPPIGDQWEFKIAELAPEGTDVK